MAPIDVALFFVTLVAGALIAVGLAANGRSARR